MIDPDDIEKALGTFLDEVTQMQIAAAEEAAARLLTMSSAYGVLVRTWVEEDADGITVHVGAELRLDVLRGAVTYVTGEPDEQPE